MMLNSFTCEYTNRECREEGDPIIIPDIHKDFVGEGERKKWIGYARWDSVVTFTSKFKSGKKVIRREIDFPAYGIVANLLASSFLNSARYYGWDRD
jgi:hypothetical protein